MIVPNKNCVYIANICVKSEFLNNISGKLPQSIEMDNHHIFRYIHKTQLILFPVVTFLHQNKNQIPAAAVQRKRWSINKINNNYFKYKNKCLHVSLWDTSCKYKNSEYNHVSIYFNIGLKNDVWYQF